MNEFQIRLFRFSPVILARRVINDFAGSHTILTGVGANVRYDSRKLFTEAKLLCCESDEQALWNHAVWVIPEDVLELWLECRRLYQTHWIIVTYVTKHG